MEHPRTTPHWVDRMVALLFATVLVLGTVAVAAALVVYFPGTSSSNVPLP